MSRETINGGVPVCPDRGELASFERGLLSLGRLEVIAEHLSRCEACESSLQAFQEGDTIQAHLRTPRREMPAVDEAACREMEDRARVIPLEETVTPTVSDVKGRKTAEGPLMPAAFGAYVLLEPLGQGGMGVVYKARQEAIKRLVALKLVRAGIYASAEERARFRREGEAIARVRHGNVVQIHEFGEHGGQPFFSMELLEGGTLASRLNGQPLPQREAAELVRTLAEAVQAAHQQGIVHRDLKPGNVLFAADGTAKITDFGLAKVLDAEGSDTRSDAILGTPSYMAPEQARGEVRSVGPLADVYALGAILYECLTGKPPFRAETRLQTLEQVRSSEPTLPSRLRSGLARDLEAICLKCLEKTPARRYPGAEALADELTRWLNGEATQARPLIWPARWGRAMRRYPRRTGATVFLALLVPLGFLAWFALDPDRPIRDAERRLARGETVVLIDKEGGPRWSHWLAGRHTAQTSISTDGAFCIHSWGQAVLALVRDPQNECYQLRAEVQHKQTDKQGSVGVFFLHRGYPGEGSEIHLFAALTFNDVLNEKETNERMRARSSPLLTEQQLPTPKGNRLLLDPHLYAQRADGPWEPFLSRGPRAVFEPAGYAGGPPHQLVVNVSPTVLRASWDDTELSPVSVSQLVKDTTNYLDLVRKDRPGDLFVREVSPVFSPRGALGLYVYKGSACFRHVVIEPLNPSP